MREQVFHYPSGAVLFQETAALPTLFFAPEETLLLTDENVFRKQPQLFEGFRTLVVAPGENSKSLDTVAHLSTEMLRLGATRHTLLVGIGGGVVTDLCGFLATLFMRGICFSFVPTTLLAMVDAAWGGKNGVNLHHTKNILGTIRQPERIVHHYALMQTLPQEEWANGFAEIIKYGAIADAGLVEVLQQNDLHYFLQQPHNIGPLVQQCVSIKNGIVASDEHETGLRKTLNFGHTAGHAIEAVTRIAHGQAVAVGMHFAMQLSVKKCGLDTKSISVLKDLLHRYRLPQTVPFDAEAAFHHLAADKKRKGNFIDFILLRKMGEAQIIPVSLTELSAALKSFSHEGNC